jgi:hypothetical protein
MAWIAARAGDKNDINAKLWQLIQFAAASKGRLRSHTGSSDPSSPEAAICDFLLSHSDLNVGAPFKGVVAPTDAAAVATSMNDVQNFLLKGQREKALEAAVAAREWPMALLIASVCDRAKYAEVVKSYVDETLHQGSPLHTLSLIFSGQSGVGMVGGEGSWMANLAGIITNRTNGWDVIVRDLGDKLAAGGDLVAAHFCMMVAGANIEGEGGAKRRPKGFQHISAF